MTRDTAPPGRADPDVARALDLLRQMSMEVHAYLADAGRAAGIGAADVACIGIVRQAERDREDLSAGALGSRLGLSPAATTALLDRMSRHGLIQRERSVHDARVVLVRITDRARELGREMFSSLNAEFVDRLARSGSQLTQLEDILADLVTATERSRRTLKRSDRRWLIAPQDASAQR